MFIFFSLSSILFSFIVLGSQTFSNLYILPKYFVLQWFAFWKLFSFWLSWAQKSLTVMEYFSGSKKLLLFILEDWKLLLFLTILFALYFYYTSTFDFFEKKGIPFKKPVILLGNLGPRLKGTQSFHEFQLEAYNNFKGNRYGGEFELGDLIFISRMFGNNYYT